MLNLTRFVISPACQPSLPLLVNINDQGATKMGHLTTGHQGLDSKSHTPFIAVRRRPIGPHPKHRGERLMLDIFEVCDIALCVIRLDRTIQFANPAFRKLGRNCPSLTNASPVAVSAQPESLVLKQAIQNTFEDAAPRSVTMPFGEEVGGTRVLISALPSSELVLLTIIPLQNSRLEGVRLSEVLRTKWSLSRREAECAILLSQGKPAKRIAEERGVSLPTIRTQLQAIREKLGVESSLEAAAMISGAAHPQTVHSYA
jgi:DNA-binding CsgD family transcriptional regulator